MSDGRLDALIGILRPKSKFASNPADIWRAMQVTLLSRSEDVCSGKMASNCHCY